MRLLAIICCFVLFSFTQVNAFEYGLENFCKIQAKAVTKKCSSLKSKTTLQKKCYIFEMEAQDFFLDQDFIIDSDGSIYCFHPTAF